MRFAYKVCHSEKDKWTAKLEAGRPLTEDEISFSHQRLPELIRLSYKSEPGITAKVMVLEPAVRGVIVVLDSRVGEDSADLSLGRCLVRINSLDPDLCLIAEPLPRSKEFARTSVHAHLDLLPTGF